MSDRLDTLCGVKKTTVHIVSLGCARNEVDSEELAGRLEAGGFVLVDEPEDAEAVVVNTCGFIDSAKKDSIDTLLAASDLKGGTTQRVVAVGCMAERYGAELAEALPEADAVLGFDAYADIDARLRRIMDGEHPAAHTPADRRRLLPLAPAGRQRAASEIVVPGLFQPHLLEMDADAPDLPVGAPPASGPRPVRRRLDGGPSAPVKIASGCDRRCAFCAIPSFRGSFVSRHPDQVVAEVRALVEQGVKEAFLVSENTTSYGKDLRDPDALIRLLGELDRVDGLEWVRVSYLQPAEVRPGLIEAMCGFGKVVPYFDLSFQHASPTVLRRMRRYGSPEQFLGLLERIRALRPEAGVRSNVIVGFPGETDADVDTLAAFVSEARLDALGVFPYSDEEGTEGADLADHVASDEVEERFERISTLASDLVDARADERVGERVRVLVEGQEGRRAVGRAAHQGPEVDGVTTLAGPHAVGEMVWATVVASEGVDLIAEEEADVLA